MGAELAKQALTAKTAGFLYKKILDSFMKEADTYPNPGMQFRSADAGLFDSRSEPAGCSYLDLRKPALVASVTLQ